MGKSQRSREPKHCDSCSKVEAVLYRIQLNPNEAWIFTCSDCQKKAKTQSTYQYGGTWKQSKRN